MRFNRLVLGIFTLLMTLSGTLYADISTNQSGTFEMKRAHFAQLPIVTSVDELRSFSSNLVCQMYDLNSIIYSEEYSNTYPAMIEVSQNGAIFRSLTNSTPYLFDQTPAGLVDLSILGRVRAAAGAKKYLYSNFQNITIEIRIENSKQHLIYLNVQAIDTQSGIDYGVIHECMDAPLG